jgi:hypothetical protein
MREELRLEMAREISERFECVRGGQAGPATPTDGEELSSKGSLSDNVYVQSLYAAAIDDLRKND